MPITEQSALEILEELIRKPDSKAEDIPGIWRELMAIYNTAFAPAPEPVVKKRRRGPKNPNIGWPAGVKREEYKVWKDVQAAKGQTENLDPQEYKRLRDLGQLEAGGAAVGNGRKGGRQAEAPELDAPQGDRPSLKTREELEASIPKKRGRAAAK